MAKGQSQFNSNSDNNTNLIKCTEDSLQSIIEDLSLDMNVSGKVAVIPTVIVVMGGWGSDTGRRIKKLITSLGMEDLVKIVVLETDQSSKGTKMAIQITRMSNSFTFRWKT